MYFIITTLIIASFFSVAKGYNFSLFIKDRTYLLKAFLPYMIFIHHSHLFDESFHFVGIFVVALFFFISGYGLETKRKSGIVINKVFLIKALKKLIIPLIIPIIIYVCCRLYNDSFDIIYKDNIKKYQIILPYTWYVVTLIILYLFFYISVGLSKGKNILYFFIIIAEILSFNLIGRFLGIPGIAHITTTAFIAGVVYKNIEINIVSRFNHNVILYTLVSSVILVIVTMWIQGNPLNNKDIPLTAFVWPILFMTLYAVIPTYNEHSPWMGGAKFLSSISYELYICQSIPFLLLGAKNQYHPIIYLFYLFILCTVVAFVCKYLTNIFWDGLLNDNF